MSIMKHSSSARCYGAGTAHSRQSSLEMAEAAAGWRWGVTGPEGRDGSRQTMQWASWPPAIVEQGFRSTCVT